MCQKEKTSIFDRNTQAYSIALVAGLLSGFLQIEWLSGAATIVSQIFINLLKLVSLPIIFLSIVSTASGMESIEEIKNLGSKVIKYTLLTTVIAATISLVVFVVINPVQSVVVATAVETVHSGSYWDYLIQSIPSNVVQPFSENHVIGVLFIAMALSLAAISLPDEQRKPLHTLFSSLYQAVMKITKKVVDFMPIAVWAFVTLFVLDLQKGMEVKSIAYYLACVMIANVIQALVVLPLLLRWKGVAPLQFFKAMLPALSVAFFSKSSAAALPAAIQMAKERTNISPKVAKFTLPLCTTINMNACAAFILTTVLFVSMSHGWTYSTVELIGWIFIATIAAVGNAGVPMGCYFMASAFLAAMNVPLHILGLILPIYTLIDMAESAINVWSDSCVAAAVQHDVDAALEPVPELSTLN